jgi:hypothetical protein
MAGLIEPRLPGTRYLKGGRGRGEGTGGRGQPELRDFPPRSEQGELSLLTLRDRSFCSCCSFLPRTPTGPASTKSRTDLRHENLISKRSPRIGARPQLRVCHGIFTTQELGPLRRRSIRFPPPHVDQLMLVCSCHMSHCAGPPVVSGTCHHSRSHWISLHICQSYPQMPSAQTTCKKAILPEMSCAAATHVVILRISSMYSPKQNSQRIFSAGHRYQMHMVTHHAPSQQSHFGVA